MIGRDIEQQQCTSLVGTSRVMNDATAAAAAAANELLHCPINKVISVIGLQ